jgi:hypothetical protein
MEPYCKKKNSGTIPLPEKKNILPVFRCHSFYHFFMRFSTYITIVDVISGQSIAIDDELCPVTDKSSIPPFSVRERTSGLKLMQLFFTQDFCLFLAFLYVFLIL